MDVVAAGKIKASRTWIEGGEALDKLVKNHMGVTVGVDVLDPGGIERSVGKMRRIIDDRPKV
jgi:phenylacetate-CoA ligase